LVVDVLGGGINSNKSEQNEHAMSLKTHRWPPESLGCRSSDSAYFSATR